MEINAITKRNWSDQEKDLIKSEFLRGSRVKTIAAIVGRSESSVNKFLSRSGIRTRRWKITRKPSGLKLKPIKTFDLSVYRPKQLKPRHQISDVIDYLKSKGYKIIIIKQLSLEDPDYKYIMDGKPVSREKLLYLANKEKTLESKPIFEIPSLMD